MFKTDATCFITSRIFYPNPAHDRVSTPKVRCCRIPGKDEQDAGYFQKAATITPTATISPQKTTTKSRCCYVQSFEFVETPCSQDGNGSPRSSTNESYKVDTRWDLMPLRNPLTTRDAINPSDRQPTTTRHCRQVLQHFARKPLCWTAFPRAYARRSASAAAAKHTPANRAHVPARSTNFRRGSPVASADGGRESYNVA